MWDSLQVYNSPEHELRMWLWDMWMDQLQHPEDRVILKPRGDGYYYWRIA